MSAEADVRPVPDTAAPQVVTSVQNPAALDDGVVRRLLRHAVVGAQPERHDTVAPFTGERATTLPISTEADVEHAFAMARRAQRGWAERTPRDRARVLLRFHDLVLEQQAEVMDIAQIETGKARRDAFEELADCALNARFYGIAGPRMLASRRVQGVFPVLTQTTIHHHPKGVVGIISPWNYPISMAITDALPALLAGNGVVLRPDLQTTVTALRVVDLLVEAGLPDGLLNVVIGDGPVVGPWVTDRADYIMFTGSTRVGREIAARAGERLVGCSLELGGKNAVVVRADADLEKSAEITERASFGNAGQLCIGTERILVHESIAEEFTALLVARVEALTLKASVGWGAGMGSLVSARQLDRVSAQVDQAVAAGAEVLTGGRPLPEVGPYYYAPTLLRGVTPEMTLCREETFGPVASIYTFSTDDEAVAIANDTDYGLNAAVLTRDVAAGRAMARRIEAGTVNVNEAYGAAWASIGAPMGGMKASGLGRRHGVEGLMKYTESQAVAVQKGIGFGAPFGRTDEQWAGLMTAAFSSLKALRVK
jgi:succinate-semialdehyde dehydrogenase/glutarate-semialdehyde dehydrogenase